MLNPQIGDVMSRITPPGYGSEGFMQTGVVCEVTATEITVSIQVDVVRSMKFNRTDGMDTSGMGSFLVRRDSL